MTKNRHRLVPCYFWKSLREDVEKYCMGLAVTSYSKLNPEISNLLVSFNLQPAMHEMKNDINGLHRSISENQVKPYINHECC